MKEYKELRFNDTNIQLKDNLVKGSILPEKISELNRTITIQSNSIIEGPVYAHKFEIQNGDAEIHGAVFTHLDLYVNSDAEGNIIFKKSVGSSNAVFSRAKECKLSFYSDINAKKISLRNAFVAGSIYGDEISLVNCVVIGGVFATQEVDLDDCIIGTFNTPSIIVSNNIYTLLPSAFSIEKINKLNFVTFYKKI